MTLLCPSHLDISPTVVSVKIKQEGISLMMKNNKITEKKKKKQPITIISSSIFYDIVDAHMKISIIKEQDVN